MGEVETKMLAYIKQRLAEGALSVTASEVIDAVVPADHPKDRWRPSYRHGLERLLRRCEINAVNAPDSTTHYFIGNYASSELRASLRLP